MLIIHGSNDALVPVETARAFAAKMAGTSDSAVVYAELHGAQHAFDLFPSPRTVRTDRVRRTISRRHPSRRHQMTFRLASA